MNEFASDVREKDEGYLRMLATCFYVFAGLSFCFSSVFIMHVIVGIGLLSDPGFLATKPSEAPPPAFMGYVFTFMGAGAVLLGWICAGCSIYAARLLKERRGYTFLFIFSCIVCVNMPLGTVLGVFTILTLQRPSVKALFGQVPF